VERESIRKLIDSRGGQLKAKWSPGCTHLEPGAPKSISTFQTPSDHTVYSLQYVRDAVKENSLPDLALYTFRCPLNDPVEVDDPSAANYKGRNKFTLAEEDLMTQYMKRYQGSYSSLAYWNKALEHGLPVQRTAYTLRDHCKRMLEGKTVAKAEEVKKVEGRKRAEREETPGTEKKVKVNPGSPLGLQAEKSLQTAHIVPSPALKEASIRRPVSMSTPPFPVRSAAPVPSTVKSRTSLDSLSPRNLSSRFEVTSDLVISIDKGRRVVADMKKYREQSEQAHILPQFLALVAKCKHKSSLQTEEEVEVLKTLLVCRGDVSMCLKHYSARG
jgi:hypothetical protein